MDKLHEFFATFTYAIGWLASIGLIVSGFDNRNPGLPIAGAILIFTLVYAEKKN